VSLRAVFLASVEADLLEIFTYIAETSDSIAIAESFITRLRQRCRSLANLPGTLGRARPELREDIRSLPYKGYVIFFRYVEDRLEIVDILEGHRDVDSFFHPDGESCPKVDRGRADP
jgi:plasmid stabilization system protein ParE